MTVGYNKNCIISGTPPILNGISIVEDTTWDSTIHANNLVINGDQSRASNYNFSQLSYHADGYFYHTYTSGNATVLSNTYVKINPKHKYKMTCEIRNGGGAGAPYPVCYVGIATYDKDLRHIARHEVIEISTLATRTTLAADLKAGDTVVYLTSAAGWSVATNYYVGFWGTAYSGYPDYTYTQTTTSSNGGRVTAVDLVNNTVTLTSARTGATIPAGTVVNELVAGGTYMYIAASGYTVTSSWVNKESAIITGWSPSTTDESYSYFRYGTEYIRVLILPNYGGSAGYVTDFRNIRFWDLTTGECTVIQDIKPRVSATAFNAYEFLEVPFHNSNIISKVPLDDDAKDYAKSRKVTATSTTYVAGHRTNCMSFNGTSDYLQLEGTDFSGQRMAIKFKIKLASDIDWNTRFDIMSGSISAAAAGRIILYRSSATELTLSVTMDSTTYSCTITGANTTFTNNWTHVVIVIRSRNVGAGYIRVYVNGTSVAATAVYEIFNATNESLYFMASNGTANFTKGYLEDMMVLDVEPTANQVRRMYDLDMTNKATIGKEGSGATYYNNNISANTIQEYQA